MIESINRSKFLKKGLNNSEAVSVLEYGYIILKDGSFVRLEKNHNECLSDFYASYHGCKTSSKIALEDSIRAMAEDGLVIYLNNYENSCISILYLIDELTDEQKDSCTYLLNSTVNKSRINYVNAIDLRIITEYEVRNILMKRNKVKINNL